MVCYNPNLVHVVNNFVDEKTGEIKRQVSFLGSARSNTERVFLSTDDNLTYIVRDEYKDDTLIVPCGHCIGCRLDRSRIWAARCVFEAQMHEQNIFLTLTYDDDHLPADYGLHKRDMQLFWKKLRKYTGIKLRYFYCGEYGETYGRPHYHAIVFGYRPSDLVLYSVRSGNSLYLSPTLAKIWQNGFVSVGDVTFESAAYVAGYILKKQVGDKDYYQGREPPYVNMSRRPGIAYDWFLRYKSDVYPNDFVIVRDGIKMRPPRYFQFLYDREFDFSKDILPDTLKIKRIEGMRGKMIRSPTNFTFSRLDARHQVAILKQKERVRDYEV